MDPFDPAAPLGVGDAASAPGTDALIAALAGSFHGVVSRSQLLRAGVEAHAVDHRIRRGRLLPLHRGVYAVGPVVAPYRREAAAVLACGERALLSHASAAFLGNLMARPPDDAPVDVTIRAGSVRVRGEGVRVRRVRRLDADEIIRVAGIPITAPARTLIDLSGAVGLRDLEQVLGRAEREYPGIRDRVVELLGRYPRRAGSRPLRRLLEASAGAAFTRSEAEDRFLALVRKARLGRPEVNVRIGGYEVDFVWRAERLVVEIDGFEFHASRRAFERDRRRDLALTARGYRVVRITWKGLSTEPEATLARIAEALAVAG